MRLEGSLKAGLELGSGGRREEESDVLRVVWEEGGVVARNLSSPLS